MMVHFDPDQRRETSNQFIALVERKTKRKVREAGTYETSLYGSSPFPVTWEARLVGQLLLGCRVSSLPRSSSPYNSSPFARSWLHGEPKRLADAQLARRLGSQLANLQGGKQIRVRPENLSLVY